jgi:hypothetical protein
MVGTEAATVEVGPGAEEAAVAAEVARVVEMERGPLSPRRSSTPGLPYGAIIVILLADIINITSGKFILKSPSLGYGNLNVGPKSNFLLGSGLIQGIC